MKPVTVDYRDLIDNRMNAEKKDTEKQPELVITTRKTHPLLQLDWNGKLSWASPRNEQKQPKNHTDKPKPMNTLDREIRTRKRTFHKLFTENYTEKTCNWMFN